MSPDEWRTVEVGDVLVERRTGRRRDVLSVRRSASGKTWLELHALHGRMRVVTVSPNDDEGGERWTLHRTTSP